MLILIILQPVKKDQMKKIIISLAVFLAFASCKGPGSGPLVRETFTRAEKSQNMEGQNHKATVQTEKINVSVTPCDGCITISDLLLNKQAYAGKVIRIKGNVTKYNPEIMGKNWVHIQDGTESGADLI